jgi:hypothetical protein
VPDRLIQAHGVDDHPIDHAVPAEGDARLSSRRINDAALLVRVAEVSQGEELRIAIGRTVGFRFSNPTGGNCDWQAGCDLCERDAQPVVDAVLAILGGGRGPRLR